MPRPIIDEDACVACGVCIDACPEEILEIGDGAVEVTEEDKCIGCGNCLEECPMGAITEIAED
jgi:NAD-dependent dihydropyrimidine dehydrogenase PreA subunit